MTKGNDYPRMLYPGGDTSGKGRIVRDADAELAAGKEGYGRAGEQCQKAPDPRESDANDPENPKADAPKKRGRPRKGT